MSSWISKKKSDHQHDQDLTTLFTTEERVELTLLIGDIAERMQKRITETFNSSVANENDKQRLAQGSEKNPNIDSSKHEETEEEEKARKMREKREKELTVPKMLELRDAALDSFHKWKDSVVTRLGEVINKSEATSSKQSETVAPQVTTDADSKVICMWVISHEIVP